MPNPKSKRLPLPRARVMHQDCDNSLHDESLPKGGGYPASTTVAVLPTATAKRARLLCKVWNMSPEQRESLMLEECERQEKAEDEGAELGRIDIIRGYLAALGFADKGAE